MKIASIDSSHLCRGSPLPTSPSSQVSVQRSISFFHSVNKSLPRLVCLLKHLLTGTKGLPGYSPIRLDYIPLISRRLLLTVPKDPEKYLYLCLSLFFILYLTRHPEGITTTPSSLLFNSLPVCGPTGEARTVTSVPCVSLRDFGERVYMYPNDKPQELMS